MRQFGRYRGLHRAVLSGRAKIAALAAVGLLVLGGGAMAIGAANASAGDAATRAVQWAHAQLGKADYYRAGQGYCLEFVHDAYQIGAGVDTNGDMRVNNATSAFDFWNHFSNLQHRGDTNPPVGAFVFWGPTTGKYANPDGHVALSIGGGQLISSYEEKTTTIHQLSLASRNGAGYPYLGWMMPPGVGGASSGAGAGGGATSGGAPAADLYFIKTKNTGSGHVEVHEASASSGYKTNVMSRASWFSSGDANNGWFQMVGPDLYFIKTKNTGSGKVEVFRADGASGFSRVSLAKPTAFSPGDQGNGWFQMVGPDLYFIKTKNTGTGKVEVFRAPAGNGFASVNLATPTAFSPGDQSNGWFQMQGADLVFIKTRNTGTGRVEYFRAPASTGYKSIAIATGTAFSPGDQNNGWFSSEDATAEGRGDVVFIKTHNPGSGRVEVFVADAAHSWQSVVVAAPSWFSPGDANNGWFQLGSKN